MIVSSIGSSWDRTSGIAQSARVATDRKVENEDKARAVEARQEVAQDKALSRNDWQAASNQWANRTSGSSNVDFYM